MSNASGRSRSRSRSRSITRSRSPPYHSGSRNRYRSRSFSPAPRRQSDYSVSPRRQAEHPRSPRGPLPLGDRNVDHKRRSYSPAYDNGADQNQSNGYAEKSVYKSEGDRGQWKSSLRRTSRSPIGSRSRSRSAELSPRRGR